MSELGEGEGFDELSPSGSRGCQIPARARPEPVEGLSSLPPFDSTRIVPNGFTLVEVLVALVVTSLLLAIVMNGAITSRERGKAAAEKREAVLLARNLLAETSVAPYAEGVRSGEENGLRWQVGEAPAQQDPRHRFVLSAIDVKITGRRGTTLFAVSTRRLKSVPNS